MGSPTLKDIAHVCEVSTATVSLVLSGKGSISTETSEKIARTAKEMGYTPKISRTKKVLRFKNVCILQWEEAPFLWHFSQPFVLDLEKVLIEEGFRPTVIHKIPELDDQSLYNEIKTTRVGAVFSIHYVNTDLFDRLESEGIPVILINNSNYQDRYWSVLTDDIQGAYEATKALIELGHRRIAYAEYVRDYNGVVADRFHGYRLALEQFYIALPENLKLTVKLGEYDQLSERLSAILDGPNPPTAFFIHDDYFAAILHKALTDRGFRVPEDISLVAPGDVLEYDETFYPRITTWQIDRPLMSRIAWELMVNRIHSESDDIKVLKTKMLFVDRGSCAAPRSNS